MKKLLKFLIESKSSVEKSSILKDLSDKARSKKFAMKYKIDMKSKNDVFNITFSKGKVEFGASLYFNNSGDLIQIVFDNETFDSADYGDFLNALSNRMKD